MSRSVLGGGRDETPVVVHDQFKTVVISHTSNYVDIESRVMPTSDYQEFRLSAARNA